MHPLVADFKVEQKLKKENTVATEVDLPPPGIIGVLHKSLCFNGSM